MRRALPALILALAPLFTGCERSSPSQPGSGTGPAAPPLEAGPGVTAVLGGLKKGDTLGPATVTRIEAPKKGRIRIPVTQGEAHGSLVITLQGDGPPPIVATKKYALFTDSPLPAQKSMNGDDLGKAVEALAERIRAHEEGNPTPSGMTSYGAKTEPM